MTGAVTTAKEEEAEEAVAAAAEETKEGILEWIAWEWEEEWV